MGGISQGLPKDFAMTAMNYSTTILHISAGDSQETAGTMNIILQTVSQGQDAVAVLATWLFR